MSKDFVRPVIDLVKRIPERVGVSPFQRKRALTSGGIVLATALVIGGAAAGVTAATNTPEPTVIAAPATSSAPKSPGTTTAKAAERETNATAEEASSIATEDNATAVTTDDSASDSKSSSKSSDS